MAFCSEKVQVLVIIDFKILLNNCCFREGLQFNTFFGQDFSVVLKVKIFIKPTINRYRTRIYWTFVFYLIYILFWQFLAAFLLFLIYCFYVFCVNLRNSKRKEKKKKMLMLLCEPRIEVLFGYVNVFCFHLLKILLSLCLLFWFFLFFYFFFWLLRIFKFVN